MARLMEVGASGRPVRAEGSALRCAVYSAVASSRVRSVAAHQAVNAVQLAAYTRRVASRVPTSTAARAAGLSVCSALGVAAPGRG